MNIEIGTTVSYDVQNVTVGNIIVTLKNTYLLLISPYVWFDKNGKPVRSGNNIYTEAQLKSFFESCGQDFSIPASVLKSLIPTGMSGNCNIMFSNDGTITAVRGYAEMDEEGKYQWISELLDASQFASDISPMTVDQINVMVQKFTMAIFADELGSSSSSSEMS